MTVSKSTAWTTSGRSQRIPRKRRVHHPGMLRTRDGRPSGALKETRWMRTPSRVSSRGYTRSRSHTIAWTSYPARARLAPSFAMRGSIPAGLFERTRTTRTAISSQKGGDLLSDLLPGRAVPVRIGPVPFRTELATDGGSDAVRIGTREHVFFDLAGLATICILSLRDARHP